MSNDENKGMKALWDYVNRLGRPNKRPWVGLTDEERMELAVQTGAMTADWLPFMEAVEAKLKDKNT